MTTAKQKVSDLLRRMQLLQFADSLMLARNVLKNRKSNRLFLAAHPDFVPPPYRLAYDAYNHTNWKSYYEMGLSHSRLVSNLAQKYISANEINVCEWGCGPARVIRHLKRIDGFDKVELFGTDYNEKTIGWCKKNVEGIQFLKNSLKPPLDADPEAFDCVYAISVFTHLSEKMQFAWIKELFRTMKAGAILIFTTHGDLCARWLLPPEKAKYDAGSLVIKDKIREGRKHFSAFHPPTFIRESLLKDHSILEHICNPAGYNLEQDVWVVRKK